MDEIKFNSLTDLYSRLLPALRCRSNEIKRLGYSYIHEEDIWNFLKETKWINDTNLSLADMVSNIMEANELNIDNYIKKRIENERRNIIKNEDNLL